MTTHEVLMRCVQSGGNPKGLVYRCHGLRGVLFGSAGSAMERLIDIGTRRRSCAREGPQDPYGGVPLDVVWFLADHLLRAHSRAACLRPLSRVKLAIARILSCSDFRLASGEKSYRTLRPLQ